MIAKSLMKIVIKHMVISLDRHHSVGPKIIRLSILLFQYRSSSLEKNHIPLAESYIITRGVLESVEFQTVIHIGENF